MRFLRWLVLVITGIFFSVIIIGALLKIAVVYALRHPKTAEVTTRHAEDLRDFANTYHYRYNGSWLSVYGSSLAILIVCVAIWRLMAWLLRTRTSSSASGHGHTAPAAPTAPATPMAPASSGGSFWDGVPLWVRLTIIGVLLVIFWPISLWIVPKGPALQEASVVGGWLGLPTESQPIYNAMSAMDRSWMSSDFPTCAVKVIDTPRNSDFALDCAQHLVAGMEADAVIGVDFNPNQQSANMAYVRWLYASSQHGMDWLTPTDRSKITDLEDRVNQILLNRQAAYRGVAITLLGNYLGANQTEGTSTAREQMRIKLLGYMELMYNSSDPVSISLAQEISVATNTALNCAPLVENAMPQTFLTETPTPSKNAKHPLGIQLATTVPGNSSAPFADVTPNATVVATLGNAVPCAQKALWVSVKSQSGSSGAVTKSEGHKGAFLRLTWSLRAFLAGALFILGVVVFEFITLPRKKKGSLITIICVAVFLCFLV